MATSSLSGLFSRLALTPARPSSLCTLSVKPTCPSPLASSMRSFHASPAHQKKKVVVRKDPRIKNLKMAMPRSLPPPLRFARNRHLRHWTIHRAWLLFQRKERERRAHELERMYQSMHNAMEELRTTSGPGTRDEGFLYRVACEKKGMYGHKAIPIEYARPQVETPAREPWNHGWTR
ncbi:hypothetical protein F4780DRAFT_741807 [Xylariomycetidae sp. FL0641]|nr:hypothetical protein F4780DRAFT_741807 [Xylariomycetidae sp. FL0641]